eukprot:3254917-Prymnesium_polylepis.1
MGGAAFGVGFAGAALGAAAFGVPVAGAALGAALFGVPTIDDASARGFGAEAVLVTSCFMPP